MIRDSQINYRRRIKKFIRHSTLLPKCFFAPKALAWHCHSIRQEHGEDDLFAGVYH